RDLSRYPLYQVMLVLQNAPMPALKGPGLSLIAMELRGTTSALDLSLYAREVEQELLIRAEYNTELFDRTTIERMMSHYHLLLAGIVADPECAISQLPLLSAAE